MADRYILDASLSRIPLRELPVEPTRRPGRDGFQLEVGGSPQGPRYTGLATRAAYQHFELYAPPRVRRSRPTPLPAAFEDPAGMLRVVYKEIVVRFVAGSPQRERRQLLGKYEFRVRAQNEFVADQVVVADAHGRHFGAALCDIANEWSESPLVRFAAPNFVSEYRRFGRSSTPAIPREQWHLRNHGDDGQRKDEDIDVRGAWRTTRGDPGVIVAIVDDGVDLAHPNLRYRYLRNPDPDNPDDRVGRDFVLPVTHPEHYDPRPKVFTYPYQQLAGNDIHGTPCAGIVAADGRVDGIVGAAPRCRILAVKVFHADAMASDAAVANAIRYAAKFADIVSCSWGGPASPDIELAIQDAGETRGGYGAAVFCAAGNDGNRDRIDFPAAYDGAIAVGASTDLGTQASYSNAGAQLSVVAPSSGGIRGIYTTDVSSDNRGFNGGDIALGDAAGLFTSDFGGTSSATPLAAAVGALCLSVNDGLDRAELKTVLEETADRIGKGYDDARPQRALRFRTRQCGACRRDG